MSDNTAEILFGLAMAILSYFYSKFSSRQQTNKKDIKQLQEQVKTTTEEVNIVKTDIRDAVLAEILEAKQDMERVVTALKTDVKQLTDKVNTLEEKLKTSEGENSKLRQEMYDQQELYKKQLKEKDEELKLKAGDIKRLTDQLEAARADFTSQNKEHEKDIRELRAEMALVQATAKGYENVIAAVTQLKIFMPPETTMPVAAVAASAIADVVNEVEGDGGDLPIASGQ